MYQYTGILQVRTVEASFANGEYSEFDNNRKHSTDYQDNIHNNFHNHYNFANNHHHNHHHYYNTTTDNNFYNNSGYNNHQNCTTTSQHFRKCVSIRISQRSSHWSL